MNPEVSTQIARAVETEASPTRIEGVPSVRAGLSSSSKRCSRCREAKPIGEFNVDRSKKDGLHHYCRPCDSQRARRWREANPEKELARKRKYREANPERVAEYQRRWVETHPEAVAEHRRKWREANPEYQLEWNKANPAKVRLYNRRKHEAGRALRAEVPRSERPVHLLRVKGTPGSRSHRPRHERPRAQARQQ